MPQEHKFILEIRSKGFGDAKKKIELAEGSIAALRKEVSKHKRALDTAVVGTDNFKKAQDALKLSTKRLDVALKQVTGDVQGYTRAAKSMRGVTSGLRRSIGALRNNLLLVSFTLGTVVAVIAKFVKDARQFEDVKTRLVGLTGSVDNAAVAFDKFNKVAATTPFSLADVVEAGAQLKAFGADAESLIKTITDLAAFMGTSAVEAANAFGRAYAGGAGAADILREKGILNIIKSSQGLADLANTTLPDFREALIKTLQDPVVGIEGSTERMSKTFTGAFSNMGDAMLRASANFGDFIIRVLKLEDAMTALNKHFSKASELMQQTNETDLETVTRKFRELGLDVKRLSELQKEVDIKEQNKQFEDQAKAIEETAKEMSFLSVIMDQFKKELSGEMLGDEVVFGTPVKEIDFLKEEIFKFTGTFQGLDEALVGVADSIGKLMDQAIESGNVDKLKHLTIGLEKIQLIQKALADTGFDSLDPINDIELPKGLEDLLDTDAERNWLINIDPRFSTEANPKIAEALKTGIMDLKLNFMKVGLDEDPEMLDDMFVVDESGEKAEKELLSKWDKFSKSMAKWNKEDADNRRERVQSLKDELAILSAVDEEAKMRLSLGGKITQQEKDLISLIIKKKSELKALDEAEKRLADFEKFKEKAGLSRRKQAIVDHNNEYQAAVKAARLIITNEEDLKAKLIEIQKAYYAEYQKLTDSFDEKEAQKKKSMHEAALRQFDSMTSALQRNLDARIESEISTLKETEAYKSADAERRADMERDVKKEYEKTQIALFRFDQASALASIIMNTAKAQMEAVALFPPAGGFMAGIISAMGAVQAAAVMAQQPPKFAKGGWIGGKAHSEGGELIEAERGEFIINKKAVQAVGTGFLSRVNNSFQEGGLVGPLEETSAFGDFNVNEDASRRLTNLVLDIKSMKKLVWGGYPQVRHTVEKGHKEGRYKLGGLVDKGVPGKAQNVINVNISGNVMSEKYTRDQIIPQIKEALRFELA